MDGTDEKVLKTNLNRPYGLCVDDVKSHLYYIQGGHGGSISCLAYGEMPCAREVFADILEYPYMCAVDNSFSKYGGPTTLVFSQANLPGQIYYIKLHVYYGGPLFGTTYTVCPQFAIK